ncbi:MAG: RNA polymerase sporulation sigma factor SigK [Bacilli bacterium]|nr:RNA polymerase sporulation sigma factor SigK [Bacilli bacterium]
MIIMLSLLTILFKSMTMFSGSYSNNAFPDPLTKEEEEKQIELLLNKDIDARNKLIEHNLRLVSHIAKKYNSKYDNDDLISIGIIGLIKGIDSFSKEKGTKLTTYAAKCIENEILMHFRNEKKNMNNISLDEKIGFDKDGNEIELIDVIKTPDLDYIEKINFKDNLNSLLKYINILTDREKTIIFKRYGIFNHNELTQKEIANELNISRSYVSRIEKRALTKLLREFIKDKNFEK